jgi:hypothetical protein
MLDEKLGFDPQVINELTTRSSSGAPISRVTLQVTWTDLETGYFEQEEWIGTGADYGDKGVYKGYTGAAKYALILNFLIPTGGGDPAPGASDPEKTDSPKSERRTRQEDAGGQAATETPEREQTPTARRTAAKTSRKKDEQTDAPEEKGNIAPVQCIEPEQIGRIKVLIGKLGEFSDPQQRKLATQGTYDALAVKLKIKELSDKLLETLNGGQAAEAITCLEMWLARREKVAHEKAEADARAAANRNGDDF